MSRTFQQRYIGANDINNLTGPNQQNRNNNVANVNGQIRDKLRVLSAIKYIKALEAVINYNLIEKNPKSQEPNNTGRDGEHYVESLMHNLYTNGLTHVLDLGCGIYGPAFFKNFKNIQYTGIDLIDIPMDDYTDDSHNIYRSDIEQPNSTINTYKYPLILAINSLEATTRPWLALRRITNLLKNNGLCILIFNQFEGSFLSTGNPFTLESLLRYKTGPLIPCHGSIFIALDSPTKRDYLIVLQKKSGAEAKDRNKTKIKPSLELCESARPKHGETIAKLDFEKIG
jgi:hypothetical protein